MRSILGGVLVLLVVVGGVVAADSDSKWVQRVHKGERFLIGADFHGANLADLDLTGAKLVAADMTDANLLGANLSDADLRGAKGLTAEQLTQARSLRGARFDPQLQAQLQQLCPGKLGGE